ncbi:MAG: diacylglycerol kinase family protein [Minicystis sp.]
MSGIGVILNPLSRRNLKDPQAALRLARALGDHGVVRTAKSRDDLARIAEDFLKLKIDVLGISGGDGTNYVTITGFLQAYAGEPLPALAFLRGGTFNTVANSVGVPWGRPEGLLSELIGRYAERKTAPLRSVERHVLRIGAHYGFIFGTGAIYGFISEYNKPQVRNAAWAAQVLLKASALVIAGKPTPVAERWEGKVTVDDEAVFPDRDYLAIAASTVDRVSLGFRAFYRWNEAPGHFHLLGIHTSAPGFVSRMPAVWRARPMGDAHTYDRIARRAVLEARSGVVRYMCDGDIHDHPGPLVVETGPIVRILVEDNPGLRPLDAMRRFSPPFWPGGAS